MICAFRELTRGSSRTSAVRNIDLQKARLSALLRDLICCFTACIAVPRTYEHVKSFHCELTRNFVTDSLICSSDQRSLHGRFDEAHSRRSSSSSFGNRSLSNGCGFDGNSSTSRSFFVIASVRKPICKLFSNAASVVGPTKVTRQSRCTFCTKPTRRIASA